MAFLKFNKIHGRHSDLGQNTQRIQSFPTKINLESAPRRPPHNSLICCCSVAKLSPIL